MVVVTKSKIVLWMDRNTVVGCESSVCRCHGVIKHHWRIKYARL